MSWFSESDKGDGSQREDFPSNLQEQQVFIKFVRCFHGELQSVSHHNSPVAIHLALLKDFKNTQCFVYKGFLKENIKLTQINRDDYLYLQDTDSKNQKQKAEDNIDEHIKGLLLIV